MSSPAHPFTALALATLWSLGAGGPLHAAPDPGDIDRVEVTGVATTARLGNGTRYELDAAELSSRGVRTLDQALALVPGLNVRTGAEGVPRVDIRGLRTRQIRLLVDGVPLNAASDGQFDPTLIPVSLIDRIVVRTGAASVLYGEGGLAGTIEIVTRRVSGPLSGAAWAQAGSGDSALGGVQIGRGEGDWSLALGAEVAEQDGLPLSSDTPRSGVQPDGLRVNSDARRRNLSARVGWRVRDDLRLSLQWLGSDADRGSPPSAIDSAADVFAQRPRYERTEHLQTQSAQLSAQWTAAGGTVLRGWIYSLSQEQDDRRFDNAALQLLVDRSVRGGFDLAARNRSDGAHLQGSMALGQALSLSVAADTRRDRFTQKGRIRDVAATGGGGGGGGGGGRGGFDLRSVDAGHAASVDSLAAELGWSLGSATQLGAGLGAVQQRRESADLSAGIYSLEARHALDPSLSLQASWARRVRAPSIAQLYDASAGNANLRLERADGAELGLLWQRQPVSLQATVFHQTVRDLIRNDDTTGRAANTDRAVFTGLELQGRWQALPMLQVSPGYTHLSNRNDSPGAAFDTLAYTPRHKLSLQTRWQASSAFDLGVDLLHVRGQVYDSRTGTPRQGELPAYTLLGLQATWRIDRVQLNLRLDNALDEAYETSYGFPQPGRSASLRAQVSF